MDIPKKIMYHQEAPWYICGVTEKENNMAHYLICPPGPFAPTPELVAFRAELLTMDQRAPEVIMALEEVYAELKERKGGKPGPMVGTAYKRRKKEFSDAWIESAPTGTWADSGCRGLRLRVSPDGAIRSFYFQYQLKNGGSDLGKRGKKRAGKIRKIALGRWPETSLAAARVKANELRDEIAANGKAPDAKTGQAPALDQAWTFGRVGKIILDQTDNPTTHGDFERYFDEPLGHKLVVDITRDDLLAVLENAAGDGTARSVPTRVLGTLRKVFDHVENHIRGIPKSWVNPTSGLKRTFKKKSRKGRRLTGDELRKIWNACEDSGCDGATKLLMLTGARRNSAGKAQWSHFDLAKKVWTIPWPLLKGGNADDGDLTVYLSPPAVALLKRLYAARQDDAGPFVFSVTDGRTPTMKWCDTKERLDAKCGVEGWVRHHLRHAFISGTARLNIMPWVTSQCVGHDLKGFNPVTAGYTSVENFEAAKRKAMNDWAKHLGVK